MKTYLDWSAYQDAGMGDAYADIPKHGGHFAKAVAVCINSRQCEAASKQVMCPSFQVSGNPHLSTGGRVRLLKAALSNDLTQEALRNPTLTEAMDLCVSCKGCKRECEANVDMALIKVEYLAQRAAREGVHLRERLFAHTPRWLHRVPWLKSLIRWRNRSPLLTRLSEQWLGLSAKQQLPEPASRSYASLDLSGVTTNVLLDGRPEVVLLVDTFTHHFEPEIAQAAVTVLRAGGYSVQVASPEVSSPEPARPLCCGRTYLVQGMLDEARMEVRRLSEVLLPHLKIGRVVVGLEASCVVHLRDDAQTLGLGEAVEALGKHILLFEEFLAREIMAKRLNLLLRSLRETETLVHGHCHQKAVGAMKAMRRVLKLIPEHNFSMIEAGCCGMAGTFGLEAEHAEMASAMAEQDLMPALRDKPAAQVIANGFSCRQQIRAHGDTRPRHLAVLLHEALIEA
ncbi:MAG: (Fe-S)-binding protein [Gammaproteobacteria bacterium]|nr:(Fe-S)-binding protein [Gammaproteobacteria bacterium]